MIISSQIIEARERGKLTVKTGLCMHTSTPNANENHARTSAIASFSCPVEKLVLSPPSWSSASRATSTSFSRAVRNHAFSGAPGMSA